MANPFDALDAAPASPNDPFASLGGAPQDPNSVRLDGGFLGSVDVPVPQVLQPVAQGAVWADQNIMAPLARGVMALPGFVGDSAEWLHDKAVGDPTNFGTVTQAMQDFLGVDPRPMDAGFVNDALEALGGGLIAAGLLSRAGPMVSLAREVPSAIASTVGQYVGADVGEAIGGDTGRIVGGVVGSFGGGMAPNAAAAGKNAAVQHFLAKPDGESAAAFRALEQAGVTPTPGLVGNKQAARLENSAANFPVVGGIVQRRQQGSFEQFQNSLYNATDRVGPRNRNGVQEAMPEDMLGGRMRWAANEGRTNLDNYFNDQYTGFYNDIPDTTLVQPNNLYDEVVRQGDAATGESRATQNAVQDFVAREIDPATRYPQGPTPSGAPLDPGVPIQVARKAGTEAFYDAQGGRMSGGAIDQVRGAWNRDIEAALMSDPSMVQAFPDEAARAAQVERLRVLNTEYALAGATDISRAGGTPEAINGRFYVGGDKPALDRVSNALSDQSAYNMGSEPGHMAVLQRTAPRHYPSIAAEVIRNEAQSRQPFGDINVSPQVYATWWNSLSDNEKLIFTNEQSMGMTRSVAETDPRVQEAMRLAQNGQSLPAPIRDTFDNLGQVGELFRQAGAQANPSGTAPTLATMGVLSGLFTHPAKTVAGLASGGMMSRWASSPKTARVIAGQGPSTGELLADAAARGVGHVANQQTQSNVVVEDAYGNRYDINGNMIQ